MGLLDDINSERRSQDEAARLTEAWRLTGGAHLDPIVRTPPAEIADLVKEAVPLLARARRTALTWRYNAPDGTVRILRHSGGMPKDSGYYGKRQARKTNRARARLGSEVAYLAMSSGYEPTHYAYVLATGEVAGDDVILLNRIRFHGLLVKALA